MKIEEIKDYQSFIEIESDWKTLINISEDSTIFQTWEWNLNWWQVYEVEQKSRRPLDIIILVAYDQNTVVGIAPLCFEKIPLSPVRQLIFLGGWQTDYCNFIIAPGYHSIVVKAFIERIKNTIGIWDLVGLKQLHSSFQTTKLMQNMAFLQRTTISTHLELPSTTSELEKIVSRTMMQNLKSYRRSLQKKYDIQLIVADSKSFIQDIESFFYLHQRRWEMKGQSGALGLVEKLFHKKVGINFLNKGYIKLFSMKANEQYIAAKCCYVYKGVMTSYLSGFEPSFGKFRLGSILNYECINYAIEAGYNFYDFGIGNEQYKMLWHPKVSAVYGWEYARQNLFSQLILSRYGQISKMITETHDTNNNVQSY
ncbi:GNAT family N-acetyltransferase [Nostoc sp.]|uniref:GNAT family N-acetyltransferase n=1 Tax=Nostoc sp. TaxID=1180 RepID=UPI002FF46CDA